MAAQSPLSYAHNIRTPLLMIDNTGDRTVPPAQADRMLEAMRGAGHDDVKLERFEDGGHDPRTWAPDDQVSRLKAIVGWFDQYR